jgi:hypothetical protein
MYLLDQEVRFPSIGMGGGDDAAMHTHKVDEIASAAAAMSGPSGNHRAVNAAKGAPAVAPINRQQL